MIKTEEYLNNGFDILDENESVRMYPILLHNLALLKIEQNLGKEALEILDRCIVIKKRQNHETLFNSYRAKLEIYVRNKDFELLNSEIEETKSTCKTDSDFTHLSILEAQLHRFNQQYEQYEQLMNKSISYFYDNEDWKNLKSISKEFTEFYIERKQYKKAFQIQSMDLHATKKIHKEL